MPVLRCSQGLALILLLFGLCLSAKGQQPVVTRPQNEPVTEETAPRGIPGDLEVPSSQGHSANQDVVRARPRLGKSFWIPWAANIALTVASVELTESCVRSHQCVEGNPILGRQPSRAELYGIRGGLLALGIFAARKEKLGGDRFLWKFATYVPLAAFSADTAYDSYETVEHSGSRNPGFIANMPASQVQIISVHVSRK
jgi:hypothetical protein